MSWTNENLAVARRHRSGEQTLVAAADIARDSLIGAFEGRAVVVPLTGDGRLDLAGLPYEHRHLLQMRRVEAGAHGSVLCMADIETVSGIDYANHSCAPNCEVRGTILLYAARDIAAGEELTLDYRQIDIAPEGIECWCETPPPGGTRCVI